MNNLVTMNNGVATTNSVIIAEQFGRKHSHVCSSIEKLKDKYGIVPISYIDNMNRPQIMYELTERQALIVMPFIGGQKSIDGQEILVDAFLSLRLIAKTTPAIESPSKPLDSDVYVVLDRIKRYGLQGIEVRTLARISNITQPACKRILKALMDDGVIDWRDARRYKESEPEIRYYKK